MGGGRRTTGPSRPSVAGSEKRASATACASSVAFRRHSSLSSALEEGAAARHSGAGALADAEGEGEEESWTLPCWREGGGELVSCWFVVDRPTTRVLHGLIADCWSAVDRLTSRVQVGCLYG